MELTKDEVRDVALLARVGITDEEVDMYQKDLSTVLGYFDKLQEVDTDGVEEIGHITGVTNVYRADKVVEMEENGKKLIMKNISEEREGYIKVKSVL
jgi:aspartyl-tRNA(Asn)/glutamyl-tRNA(Gln) amidotransferase subunit C